VKNSVDIQEALRLMMDDKDLSMYDLAESLGVTQATVSRWTTGVAKKIRAEHWANLSPMLEPYLTREGLDLSSFTTAELFAELQRRIK
jgi:DNA-binding Xre family transcriptional regulator